MGIIISPVTDLKMFTLMSASNSMNRIKGLAAGIRRQPRWRGTRSFLTRKRNWYPKGIPLQSSGLDSALLLLRAWVLSLVGELRSYKALWHSQKNKIN